MRLRVSASELQPTGERLLPEHYRGRLVHAEHVARYRLATQLAGAKRVLDAACGEGYGSGMLRAAGAESVTAVDLDSATVAHARKRHGIDALVADIRSLPFDDDAFDLVVSFETIEHVEDPGRALDELSRVLAPGGLLMISTPVAGQYLVENEFHVREFEHDEFLAALRGRFAAVRPLFQHNWLTSAILEDASMVQSDGESVLALDLAKVSPVPVGDELFLIALCGEDVEVSLRQVGVMAGTDQSHELAHRLGDAVQTQERYKGAYEDSARQLEDMRRRLDEITSSRCWRLTKPLRAGKRLRVGKRLRRFLPPRRRDGRDPRC